MSVSAFAYAVNNFFRVLFEITGTFYSSDATGPVTTSVRFNSDGTVDKDSNIDGVGARGSWFSGAPRTGVGSGYEIRSLSAGASGGWFSAAEVDDTWVALSSNRTWTARRTTSGVETVVRTFEIRRVGGSSALDSHEFTVEAEVII